MRAMNAKREKFRQFLMIWLGTFLTALPMLYLIGPMVLDMPVPIKALIFSGFMVLTMQVLTMPVLNKLLIKHVKIRG